MRQGCKTQKQQDGKSAQTKMSTYDGKSYETTHPGAAAAGASKDFTLASDDVLERARAVSEQIAEYASAPW